VLGPVQSDGLGEGRAIREQGEGELRAMGYDLGATKTPITPVILGEEERAVAFSQELRERGIYAPSIAYPIVPLDTARLRLAAFTLAGLAAGLAGGLFTYAKGSAFPTYISIPRSVDALLMVLMGGVELPTRAIREQIANSIHVVVQQQRFVDGSRKITSIAEVIGMDDEGTVHLEPIFEFHRTPGERGQVWGDYRATVYMHSFGGEFITMGLCTDGELL